VEEETGNGESSPSEKAKTVTSALGVAHWRRRRPRIQAFNDMSFRLDREGIDWRERRSLNDGTKRS